MKMRVFERCLWLAVICCAGQISGVAHAQSGSEPQYNVYSLSSEASAEVANDLMIATLVVQQEDADPAKLAEKVNETMRWAMSQLDEFDTLKVSTRDYQTYPRYDTSQVRRLIGWRATQSLQLETEDFSAASQAIQTLQERLQVQGIRHMAQELTRRQASDALISEALDAFKARAELVQQNMGASGYQVLDVNIQTGESNTPMFTARAEMADMVRSSVATEPALEAGTSRVNVQVFGRVQLD
ncbi:SIMPL domain-containing protein [Granulosicoccus sp. 3-233]|uniref:SIMPL domain-containing protein n=1 Tax=Granulosicoccus sp. 3-233 TaxID=3417969 RepID=UPI003D356769